MTKKFIIIYTTFPDLKTAKKIINALLRQKLIACANIFKVDSIYTWKKKIERAKECGVLMKTKKTNYKIIQKYIKEKHPYEVPVIVCWNIEAGLPSYLQWIENET